MPIRPLAPAPVKRPMPATQDDAALLRRLQGLLQSGALSIRSLSVQALQVAGDIRATGAITAGGRVNARTTKLAVPPMEVYSIAAQSLPTGVFTKLALDTRFYDPSLLWSTINLQHTIRISGTYIISAAWTPGTNAAASPLSIIALFLGGNELRRGSAVNVPANGNNTVAATFAVTLLAGQVIDLRAFQNSGGAYNTLGGSNLTYADVQYVGNY